MMKEIEEVEDGEAHRLSTRSAAQNSYRGSNRTTVQNDLRRQSNLHLMEDSKNNGIHGEESNIFEHLERNPDEVQTKKGMAA